MNHQVSDDRVTGLPPAEGAPSCATSSVTSSLLLAVCFCVVYERGRRPSYPSSTSGNFLHQPTVKTRNDTTRPYHKQTLTTSHLRATLLKDISIDSPSFHTSFMLVWEQHGVNERFSRKTCFFIGFTWTAISHPLVVPALLIINKTSLRVQPPIQQVRVRPTLAKRGMMTIFK